MLFPKLVAFATLAALYSAAVEQATKYALTAGSLVDAGFVNRLYDYNHWLIQQIPYIGENLLALARTWVSDGQIVFWEVWFLLIIPIWFIAWLFRSIFAKPKPRGA